MISKITLKAARVNANLTQNQVCKILNVTKKTLSSWEHGKTFPREKKHIDSMCDLYNVEYDDLNFSPKQNA